MHILGLQGMIRRTYTYPESLGLTFWNEVATVGAFLIALSILVFLVNVVVTHAKARPKRRRRRRPLGRADARMDDALASSGPQLRRDPHGPRAG